MNDICLNEPIPCNKPKGREPSHELHLDLVDLENIKFFISIFQYSHLAKDNTCRGKGFSAFLKLLCKCESIDEYRDCFDLDSNCTPASIVAEFMKIISTSHGGFQLKEYSVRFDLQNNGDAYAILWYHPKTKNDYPGDLHFNEWMSLS